MGTELKLALRNQGILDPRQLKDYLDRDGYQALEQAKKLKPRDVVEIIRASGLRGRGGAGFNTGEKMGFALPAMGANKYIVSNLDEGEPGTYKDRTIVENDPHTLLEGMAIAAYAIGADRGFIYCRGEYPQVALLLKDAIKQAKVGGQLAGFDFQVRLGAGAYVCGEETALIESLEGRRGEPRFKPPYPGVKGYFSQPTLINNVETLAVWPVINTQGAGWFKVPGDPADPVTKIFTLSGDVKVRRAVELTTDATLREIIFGWGGGIKNDRRLQAAQVGGSSGTLVPPHLLDTRAAFDTMAAAGLSLGTGAVLVLDETRDLPQIILRICHFFEHESCGKCTPCREGTFRLYELWKLILAGKAPADAEEKLADICWLLRQGSLCGLGQAASGPLESYLNFFTPEITKQMRLRQGG